MTIIPYSPELNLAEILIRAIKKKMWKGFQELKTVSATALKESIENLEPSTFADAKELYLCNLDIIL
jgi:hypothetical protein